MNTATSQNVELPGGFAPNPVLVKGEGAPVVYLHGPFGQEWDGFLDDLAAYRRVYAPRTPAPTTPTTSRISMAYPIWFCTTTISSIASDWIASI